LVKNALSRYSSKPRHEGSSGSCVWAGVRDALVAAGQDVVWTGDWAEDPGDEEILAFAFREARVLITLDKDFGRLLFLQGRPHTGIVRLVGLSTRQQVQVCLQMLAQHKHKLAQGAVITAESDRVRIRQASG
jgi:predicted nuclease of predicted toxin-antitoxin system